MMPIMEPALVKQGGQEYADRVMGDTATSFEVILTQSATTMMYMSESKSTALASASVYLLVEVTAKALYKPYIEWYYSNDAEGLAKEKRLLEVRVVNEAIGEKMCIMMGPFLAHALGPALRRGCDDDDHVQTTPGELAEIGGTYLLMEEMVDALVIVLLARYSINALRVRPRLSVRSSLVLGLLTSGVFGFMKMAALGAR